MSNDRWEPPSTWEERLKTALLPPRLYIRYRAAKEIRRGEPEARLLPFLVDRRRCALDVGANKGTYSHLLSRLARTVYAFEPNPKMYRLLARTAAPNVRHSAIALSNHSGTAHLRIPKGRKGYSNQGGSLSPVKDAGEVGVVEVNARRMDELDLRGIGFIKIDVEGYEMEVLAGAVATLERERPVLLIEIEERHNKRPIEESLARVVDMGYRCLFIDRASGTLRPLEAFDPVRHHRRPQGGYVFNFVFLPLR